MTFGGGSIEDLRQIARELQEFTGEVLREEDLRLMLQEADQVQRLG